MDHGIARIFVIDPKSLIYIVQILVRAWHDHYYTTSAADQHNDKRCETKR